MSSSRVSPMRRAGAAVVLGLALAGAAGTAPAAEASLPDLRYEGMQQHRAKLFVDRRLHLVGPGEAFRPAMSVLSVNRREVVLDLQGRTYLLRKGARQATALADEVVVPRDPYGMFVVEGEINARPATFVVDTGATWVAISGQAARRMKLRYRKNRPVKVQTASGVETAYLTTLQSVRIGGLVRSDVAAIVTKGKHPDVVLLGMSFLSGLSIRQDDATMTIKP